MLFTTRKNTALKRLHFRIMYEFKDSHNEVQYSFICLSACISMLTCAPNGCKRNRKNEEKFVKGTQIRLCDIVKLSQKYNPFLQIKLPTLNSSKKTWNCDCISNSCRDHVQPYAPCKIKPIKNRLQSAIYFYT